MFAKDARRVLFLVRQWQAARCWRSAYHHADLCREQENKGYNGANSYPFESTRHYEQAKEAREIVDARHAELAELENLLRQHAPKLFGLIPVEINFWNSPPADLSPWLNAMRQIEAEFLVLVDEFLEANPAEPAPTAATIEPKSEAPVPVEILDRLAVVFGDSGGKMVRVINNKELSTDQKLRAMERIDKPLMASIKSSEKFGEVLGVTGQAIRNTDWWKERQKRPQE